MYNARTRQSVVRIPGELVVEAIWRTKQRKPGDQPADTESQMVQELGDEGTKAKNSKP